MDNNPPKPEAASFYKIQRGSNIMINCLYLVHTSEYLLKYIMSEYRPLTIFKKWAHNNMHIIIR